MMAPAEKTAGLIKQALKKGRVISDPAVLSSYVPSPPVAAKTPPPMLAAMPADVEELRALVALANSEGIKLAVVSSGKPHCRGGSSRLADQVAVDLSGWNKVLRIDRRNRVCMIEPGVGYGELLRALEPHGMTVSMPLSPRGSKSVLAAAMDREPSTWPRAQWDVADPVASTEIVFGTGDLFRTGAAGGPGTLEQQRKVGGAQKSPMGPSQTDFHRVVQGSQATMGIATWITLRTELKPSVQEPRLLRSEKLEDLIMYVYDVQRSVLGEHSFITNRAATAMLMGGNGIGPGDLPPGYICLQNVAGFERLPRERVECQLADIGDIASGHGLTLEGSAGKLSARNLLEAATRPFGENDWRGADALSLFFLTTLDKCPRLIAVMEGLCRDRGVPAEGMGIYIQPIVQNHGCHLEFVLEGDAGRMAGFEEEAVEALMEAGAFFSRPYGAAEKRAFAKNPLNLEVLKKIKRIFDPNGVLNPGRFGLS